MSYRPDGRRLAVLCGEGELVVFDSDGGHETLRWRAHDAEPAHHWINNGEIRFSPDGRSLLTWGMGNDVRVWDPETGRLRYAPLRHRDKCHDLQFSPDGRLMALASYDGSVRVRDFAMGNVLAELPAHPDIVYSASFSPDGRLLVTACRDYTVRVWDWRAGRMVLPAVRARPWAVADHSRRRFGPSLGTPRGSGADDPRAPKQTRSPRLSRRTGSDRWVSCRRASRREPSRRDRPSGRADSAGGHVTPSPLDD